MESLGSFYNLSTPITTGLIDCASAALKRDFRKEGRTVDSLGEEYLKQILFRDENILI